MAVLIRFDEVSGMQATIIMTGPSSKIVFLMFFIFSPDAFDQKANACPTNFDREQFRFGPDVLHHEEGSADESARDHDASRAAHEKQPDPNAETQRW